MEGPILTTPFHFDLLLGNLHWQKEPLYHQTRHAFAFKLLGWTPFFTVRNDLWRCDEEWSTETSTWDLRRLAEGKEDLLLSHSIIVLVPQRGRGRPSGNKEESFLSRATKPSFFFSQPVCWSWRAWICYKIPIQAHHDSCLDDHEAYISRAIGSIGFGTAFIPLCKLSASIVVWNRQNCCLCPASPRKARIPN